MAWDILEFSMPSDDLRRPDTALTHIACLRVSLGDCWPTVVIDNDHVANTASHADLQLASCCALTQVS